MNPPRIGVNSDIEVFIRAMELLEMEQEKLESKKEESDKEEN